MVDDDFHVVRVNRRKLTPIFLCPYCECLTPRYHHLQVYCHKTVKPCSINARKEYENEYHKLYQKRFNKHQLGSSNLREHANKDMIKEVKAIMRAKRKIKPIDIKVYEEQIRKLKEYEEYI